MESDAQTPQYPNGTLRVPMAIGNAFAIFTPRDPGYSLAVMMAKEYYTPEGWRPIEESTCAT